MGHHTKGLQVLHEAAFLGTISASIFLLNQPCAILVNSNLSIINTHTHMEEEDLIATTRLGIYLLPWRKTMSGLRKTWLIVSESKAKNG